MFQGVVFHERRSIAIVTTAPPTMAAAAEGSGAAYYYATTERVVYWMAASNGNLATDGDRTLTYDARNQLTGVAMKDGTVAAYAYDYTGARVVKKVQTKDAYGKSVETTTHHLGEAVEVRLPTGDVGTADQVVLHVYAGAQRIASRNLGSLAMVLAAPAGTLAHATPPFPGSGAQGEPYWGQAPIVRPLGERTRGRGHAGHAPLWTGLALLLLGGLLLGLFPLPWWEGARGRGSASRTVRTLVLSLRTANGGEAIPRAAFASRGLALLLITVLLFPPHGLRAGDVGLPLPTANATPWRYYYHHDHLGSLHLITEGMPLGHHAGLTFPRGTVVQRFEYTAWGQERFALNPNLPVDPRYTGQHYDLETGLYYYRARYYNPVLARFVQPDPIVSDPTDPQAWNRYAYVRNNPLKYIDPSGYQIQITIETSLEDQPPPAPDPIDAGAAGLRHEGDERAGTGGLVGTTTGVNGNMYVGVLSYVVVLQFYAENNPFSPALGVLQAAGASALATAGAASEWLGTTTGCDATCQLVLGVVAAPELTAASLAAGTLGKFGWLNLAGRFGANAAKTTVGQGTKVFRVWGDEAGAYGRSWTTVDPRTVAGYRNAGGMPNQNTGRFLSEGVIQDATDIRLKPADPLHGNAGGLPEVIIPNPAQQIILQNVQGLNPQL